MNERIKELAEQAGLWNDMKPTRRQGRYVGYMNVSDMEKFAELIVKECADISDASFHDGSAGYTAILKHFGVV